MRWRTRRIGWLTAGLWVAALAAAGALAASAPAGPAGAPPAGSTLRIGTVPSGGSPAAAPSIPSAAPAPSGSPAPSDAPTTVATPAPSAPAAGTEALPKPTFPYTGEVTGDLVNVRSGPGLYYYPVAVLKKETRVTVEAQVGEWLALRPPEGVVGLVRKSDLAIDPSGGTAAVASPKARVYASGPQAKWQWCVATVLDQGDTIALAGPAEGEFVPVAPPKEMRVYILADYVRALPAGAAPTPPGEAAAGQPQPPGEAESDEVAALIKAFEEADRALKAEMRKEIGQRDFDAAAKRYQEIHDESDKDYIKRACQQRLAFIEGLREQQAEYRRVEALGRSLDERLAEIRARFADRRAEQDIERRMARKDFVAEGLVAPLEILEGVDYPIKFKLVDQNNRPLVVLKSTRYDLSKFVGKVVGVRGTKEYLKDWRIYCVTVDDLEVLEE